MAEAYSVLYISYTKPNIQNLRNAHNLQGQREDSIQVLREALIQSKPGDGAVRQRSMEMDNRELYQVHALNSSSRGRFTSRGQVSNCYRCGGKHQSMECSFKESTCFSCNKRVILQKCAELDQDLSPRSPGGRRTYRRRTYSRV